MHKGVEMGNRILLVEDEPIHLRMLSEALDGEGYLVDGVESGQQALDLLAAQEYATAVFDIRLPDIDGFELLKFSLQQQPGCPVLMMTGQASVSAAVEAMRIGAFDYLAKPFRMELLLLKLQRLLKFRRLTLDQQRSVDQGGMVGQSPALQQLLRDLRRAGPSGATVLLCGETGCGKELAARFLHKLSSRSAQALVAVNCAAIPAGLLEAELFGYEKGAFTDAVRRHKGFLEQASGGTLFLDEIGEISPPMQVKLLRVLEERELMRLGGQQVIPVDFRLIAATHRDLDQRVQSGQLRQDFYYRINVVPLSLPPLRDRLEDLPLLLDHFIDKFSRRAGAPPVQLSPSIVQQLCHYHYPGNIRELENLVERLQILYPGQKITIAHLPPEYAVGDHPSEMIQWFRTDLNLKQARRHFEKRFIELVLREEGGSRTRTAQRLGISRKNLWERMNRS
jgi:DNA-binding NtrC family response regulator